jgi:hypothetical protein
VTGLADRSPVREYIWFDPALGNGQQQSSGTPAPTVPLDSEGADEVAEHGEHDDADRADSGEQAVTP